MKKFTIEVNRASPAQLTTIALELKIMANGWEKFGPKLKLTGSRCKRQASGLKAQASSYKPQATSLKKTTIK